MKIQNSKFKIQTKSQIKNNKSNIWKLFIRIWKFVWILFFGFCISTLVAGCSRTVTTMPTFGSEAIIEINLAGTANVTDNRYFVVFSTNEAFQIPLPALNSADEFLEPGDLPQAGGKTLAEYFDTYYSTWSGYVAIDSQGYSVVKGSFSATSPVTRESISGLGNISNKLSFSVQLSRIFGSSLPQKIYFDIISASYPAGSAKYLIDRVTPPTIYFEPISGTILQRSDTDTESVSDPALDISNWKVSIP